MPIVTRCTATLLSFALAAGAAAAPPAAPSPAGSADAPALDAAYRTQLLQLAAEDQRIRAEALKTYTPQQLQQDPGKARALAMEMHAAQKRNQLVLAGLMQQHGFPDTRRVGEDGAKAAFLVAQHVADPAFRAAFLQGIDAAAQQGAYSKADQALYLDRNRILSGQPQVYGTQRKADGSLFEVEQPEQLQARRAAVGLPPETTVGE